MALGRAPWHRPQGARRRGRGRRRAPRGRRGRGGPRGARGAAGLPRLRGRDALRARQRGRVRAARVAARALRPAAWNSVVSTPVEDVPTRRRVLGGVPRGAAGRRRRVPLGVRHDGPRLVRAAPGRRVGARAVPV